MNHPKEKAKERRRYHRYETQLEVRYSFVYDVKTLVKFQVKDRQTGQALSRKYSALSKNVNVEGLCFTSGKRLKNGDLLHLEVYVPGAREPVHMEGGVMWSKPDSFEPQDENKFDTGVRLFTVQGRDVQGSLFFDEANKLYWSVILESIFGSFKGLAAQFRSS
jgi:hypothetical protein